MKEISRIGHLFLKVSSAIDLRLENDEMISLLKRKSADSARKTFHVVNVAAHHFHHQILTEDDLTTSRTSD